MEQSNQSIMFVAGEPSGDEHASHVIARVREETPGLTYFGVGGPLMAKQGFEALLPFAPFNRMGLAEVLPGLVFFARAKKFLTLEMARRKPRLVVLVDYAGFNIPMMRAAKRLGISVLWYISPKVWAWKKSRAKTLGEHATWIACILPFEPPYFEGYAAKPVYVGNPCVEDLQNRHGIMGESFAGARPPAEGQPWRIALVPGSRRQEIQRIFPSIAETAAVLGRKYPAEFKVSVCRGLDKSLYEPWLGNSGFAVHEGPLDELLAWANLALVTSGTATLQASLMGVPHVLVYKMTWLNELAYKLIVRFPFIGLPNIIAGEEIIRECMQKAADPEPLSGEVG
ncbi:MAG: lipid-A-disaccharide synthase, partial [Chitinivibrionales bacterium]|nr:lipid-A-disaccharide synthase [Chitinivibrionales bacterium]MBD3394453.1 lipid-A-disaccharide synthase [Chitinivibrionales bacterium]